MKSIRMLGALAVLALALGGCAVGNTVDYTASPPDLATNTDKKVVVAVLDQRSYVLNGDKKPTFVGFRRGGFGNPFDVSTGSGMPFADEVATAIVDGLKARDVSAKFVSLAPSADPQTAFDAVTTEGAERGIVLLIGDWKTDIYAAMELDYSLVASIAAADGETLARTDTAGNDALPGGNHSFEAGYAREANKALNGKLQELLNDPEMLEALE